ncbi:MAG TPA: hypothetical protein VFX59_13830 [Polyangiales bacterium]|nr:hypothetical protein [Polyangiales bacterium]
MRTIARERRTRRSYQPQEALSYQLEHVREEAGLDALVLATRDGLSIAYSGEDELCLELAALGPFLQEADNDNEPRPTRVRAMNHDGLALLLISYGLDDARAELDGWLEHATQGITRILAS